MGMMVWVYKCDGRSSSNGGITEHHDRVVAVNIDGPFEPTDEMPAVLLVERTTTSPILVPAERNKYGEWVPLELPESIGPMFGGCYAAASDSRFSRAIGGYHAIAIHDRFESPELYNLLSS
jgi:hypothetical protein